MDNIYGSRTDLILEKQKIKKKVQNTDCKVFNSKDNEDQYRTIHFSNLNNKEKIKDALKKEIIYFLSLMHIPKKGHFFIVGLGNENHTADSVGPKTLQYLNVNAYLEPLGITIENNKISALEPGVLGETGIETNRIIESVVKEIKPDVVILIDAYVSEDINYLNKTIQITNAGIIPGSGLKGLNSEISYKSLKIPVLVIGVPTAIEVTFSKTKKEETLPYILSTKNVDEYVLEISKVIADALNETINYF